MKLTIVVLFTVILDTNPQKSSFPFLILMNFQLVVGIPTPVGTLSMSQQEYIFYSINIGGSIINLRQTRFAR